MNCPFPHEISIYVDFKKSLNNNIKMLSDLQKVENTLYSNESIEEFLKVVGL